MSQILVVEPESRYVERIRTALANELGVTVSAVEDPSRALQVVASSTVDLVMVNTEIDGAEMLLTTFTRRNGGSGVIALLPERRSADAESLRLRADAVLVKPFGEQELRMTVRRFLGGTELAAESATRKLTSADIFGDLLAEFHDEPSGARATTAKAQVGPDEEIRRKLEHTLSGVMGTPRKAPVQAVPPAVSAPAKRSVADEADLDALLTSRLQLDRPKPRPAAPQPAAPPAPQAVAPPAPRPQPASPPPPPSPKLVAPPALEPVTVTPIPPAMAPSPPAAPPRPVEPAPFSPPPAPPVPPPVAPSQSEPGLAPRRISMSEIAQANDAEGPVFGQYQLLEKIAVGGMAEVWKARMRGVEGFQKTVAIKKILPHLTDNSAFVSMFIDEAKLAAQLAHPNITHIYDLGKIGHDYYIAMEFVEGRNLRALLNSARRTGQPFPVGLSVLIASRLASALDYAHRKKGFDGHELGLVHRDVSPQNVLISNEGDIKLCDFGIVKAVSKASHTQMGALKGKLQYMSPEQAWGRLVDGRSDLFSLGAILFELLTGRRLFPGDNEISVLEAVRECRIEAPRALDPSIPKQVDDLVLRALARDPNDRFQSAGAMQQALEEMLYALKPTPTQADLAAFERKLATGVPIDEVAAPEPPSRVSSASYSSPSPASSPKSWLEAPVVAAPGAASRASSWEVKTPPPAVEPAKPTRPIEPASPPPPALGRVQTVERSREEAVAVAPPEGEPIEIEEGGSRGKTWLVAAIVGTLVLGVLAWLWLNRTPAPPPANAPATEAPAEPDATNQSATDQNAATVTDPAAGAEAPPVSDTVASDAAVVPAPPPNVDMAQLVDQEVARREEDFKRKLDAQQKKLEQQVKDSKATEDARRLTEQQQAEQATADQARREEEARLSREAETRQREADAKAASEREQPPPQVAAAEIKSPEPAAPQKPVVQLGQLVQMGPGVVPPALVSFAKPEYPATARRLRVEGTVEAEVLVDETGSVAEARLSQPIRQNVGINEAALAAARTAKFRPATKDGVKVKIWTKIKIPFKL